MAPLFGIDFVGSVDYFLFKNLWIDLSCADLSGVHDSYWTHACDVDRMNIILREKFVELYEMPILENVRTFLSFPAGVYWFQAGPIWYLCGTIYLKCLTLNPVTQIKPQLILLWTTQHFYILFQKSQLLLYQVCTKMNI